MSHKDGRRLMSTHKVARDLAPGDVVKVQFGPGKATTPATVLAAVPSVQTVKRSVMMVTLRGPDGRDAHRTYGQLRTLEVLKGAPV